TGFGSGNVADYWGSVVIQGTGTTSSPNLAMAPGGSVSMVSPAPEPSTTLLMLLGLLFVGWLARPLTGRTGDDGALAA
ncbi:MAG: hypothetical protein RLZZ200_83, partial [Pseudomonadota bacterium]